MTRSSDDLITDIEGRTGAPPGTLGDGSLAFLRDADDGRLARIPEDDVETLINQLMMALPTRREMDVDDGEDAAFAREETPLGDTQVRAALMLVGREMVQADDSAITEETRALLMDICPHCGGPEEVE